VSRDFRLELTPGRAARPRGRTAEPRRVAATASASTPWWTAPDRLLIFVILPLALMMCAATAPVIRNNRVGYSAPIFLDGFYVTLVVGGILIIAAAAFLARQGTTAARDVRFRHSCLDFLFVTCLAGYCIWYGPLFVTMPDLLIRALTADVGATYAIREAAPTLPGVTTITQFGIVYVCIFTAAKFVRREALPGRYSVYLAAIFALALFRALTNSERIAVIELLFPFLLFLCRSDRLTRRLPTRLFRQTLPILMLFGSPVFFAVFEYNRSWINHYQFEYNSYWEFVLDRWAFYYVTALNNLCGFLATHDWPTYAGQWTMQWLYRLPLLGGAVAAGATDDSIAAQFDIFLKEYASDEFNNTTGLLVVFYDWGLAGGAIFLALYGAICGFAYRSFRAGRGALQYAFPLMLYSLIEIMRIGYLYEGRSFAAFIGLAIVYVVWGRVPAPASAR
jgi:oligosaccharide repeat unit polymerase